MIISDDIIYKLLLFVVITFCSCQNNESDSTINTSSNNDTNAVIELLKQENENISSNPKLAIHYGNKAISLSQSLNYKTGYIKGMLYMGQVYMNSNNYVIAKRYFLSALKYSQVNEQKNYIPVCLGSIGIANERLSNYSESIKYYTKCKEAFLAINDTVGIIKSQINISNVYKDIGERSKAVSVLLDGIKTAELIGDEYIKCRCLNN